MGIHPNDLPHETHCPARLSKDDYDCRCYVKDIGIRADGSVDERTVPAHIRSRLRTRPRGARDVIRDAVKNIPTSDPLKDETLHQLDKLDQRPLAKVIPLRPWTRKRKE